MSSINAESGNQTTNNGHSDDDDYDEDELITFQIESKDINVYYLKFCKYSKLIRNGYLITDVKDRFPKEIVEFQTQNAINTDNIYLFFDLLQQNFDIDESSSFTYKQYIDLFKISEFLQVKKLMIKLTKYFQTSSFDCNFIIQIIQYELSIAQSNNNQKYEISLQMEEVMSQKINDCLKNDEFANLPISIIYRILSKSGKQENLSNDLFDFINKAIERFYVLLSFLDVGEMSDEKFQMLFQLYTSTNDRERAYFRYLPCSLEAMNELKFKNKSLQTQLDEKSSTLTLKDVEIQKLNQKADDYETEIKKLNQKADDYETEIKKLNQKVNDYETTNQQLNQKVVNLDASYQQLVNKLNEIEMNKCQVEGMIEARATSGLLFDVEFKLVENGSSLNTTKSRYIINTSSSESLGLSAYGNGELITSLNQKLTNMGCKQGTYYVHACAFDIKGRMNEIVSNPVEIHGSDMEIEYTHEPKEIILNEGKYKLEVWGAQGGNSAGGKYRSDIAEGNGGLGGYSKGILNLTKPTKVIVYVGGEGKSGNSSDGSETKGGFPDGGGTKTGHYSGRTSVPGTGGGSTSIRINTDSIHSRVIVAGGGGGASGNSQHTDHGGFGGGTNGGNSYCVNKLRDQGAGTQIGSTPGPAGSGPPGVAGTFGRGATGLYKSGKDSGGGGGGGWYGGGSGGYGGSTDCSSGGGGSGWIFTETSFNAWKSGNSSDSKDFTLNPTYYLTDAITMDGSSSFPNSSGTGNETGHRGNGYAKITPQ